MPNKFELELETKIMNDEDIYQRRFNDSLVMAKMGAKLSGYLCSQIG